MDRALVDALVALAPAFTSSRVELAAWCEQLEGEIATRWPRVKLDPQVFAEHLLGKAAAHSVAELQRLDAAALYLACACMQAGGSAAIEALEQRYADDLKGIVRHQPKARQDELAQELRHKLFLPHTGKIASYSGRGPLGSWLRIVAKRTYLDLQRGAQRRPDQAVEYRNAGVIDGAAGDDPELGFLKRVYRDEFRNAFGEAMASLSPRDRNVLRHHFVDRMSIDEIGDLYRVHRATAGRWIGRARASVLTATRARMLDTLEVGEGELDSIMRLIESRLDVTVSRHLE